ncbi:4-alpha-glucanotransferase [Shewanella acanthi]|uniref:4-alpha-glucanotransferase n=1 Tax=Shewanella acanthi TaxID=2864212 RepID=UPI001C655E5E|nr:4-alpha-glucanotransferase [Shewanella acanthi]QYJ77895.1 4-alpha-glucanotransferase [Shewanella acanthi]
MGLEKLLYLRGVGADFTDCFGQYIRIPETDRQGILACMLANQNALQDTKQITSMADEPPSDAEIEAQIYQLDAHHWTQIIPAFHWCYVDEPWVCFYLPSDFAGSLRLTLECESGAMLVFDVLKEALIPIGDYCIQGIDGVDGNYVKYRFDLLGKLCIELPRNRQNIQSVALDSPLHSKHLSDFSALSYGYHHITVTTHSAITDNSVQTTHSGTLMVAPRTAYQGILAEENKGQGSKPWGISIQLYSLRSEAQWGIGDFGDLGELIEEIAPHGADFIQLNPLHALDIAAPDNPSPYSPCDRRRLNPLYICIQDVPEYQLLTQEFSKASWQQDILQLNQGEWLDYPKISELKYRAFEKLYSAFCEHHLVPKSLRSQEYQTFVAEQGGALLEFAKEESHRSPSTILQDEGFYLYLQFVAESQLKACQRKAQSMGMQLGLVRDLAVGAALHGVEVQANAAQFCLNASIGAPPDPFAPQGQNWGLTPLDPIKLKQHDFQHFIALTRANMIYCGALRIDHVMGLLRLWWWPLEKQLGHGAYVYYPVETLFAILCLESQRAQCIVIGEDLGIVPPDIIHRLYIDGIYSNELFYFCKDHQGFKHPSQYKSQSLMMLANHDVPTLVAWWTASDLQLRRQLNLFDSDQQLADALGGREHEKYQLSRMLISNGYLDEAEVSQIDLDALLTAWMGFAASGNSALYSVQWCDLLGDRHAVNIPGTWHEYPNWQRRLPTSIKTASTDINVQTRLRHIAAKRKQPSGTQ